MLALFIQHCTHIVCSRYLPQKVTGGPDLILNLNLQLSKKILSKVVKLLEQAGAAGAQMYKEILTVHLQYNITSNS